MKSIILVAALSLAVTPAMAESMGEATGVNSALGIAPKTADFVREAAISDMFEIKSSQLAEQKSNGATKTFAARMVADHTKTSDELKAMVHDGSVKVELPTALDSAHQKMLDKLQSLNGNDFDRQYHSDQDSGHKDAVSLFERYAKGGDDAKLKDWASKTLPTLQDHYKMAQDLDKSS